MNVIFKSAGTITVGALLVGWGMLHSEENFEKMSAHYQLSAPQVEFARSCMSSLSSYDKEFKGGAASYMGCGCMASNLADSEDPDADVNYLKMADGFRSIAKYSETDADKQTDVVGLFQDMTENQGLSYPEALQTATELGRVTDMCKDARLPKTSANTNAVGTSGTTYQPTATDAPSNAKGCEGLSPSAVETLQKIADRDGKSLEDICKNVVS